MVRILVMMTTTLLASDIKSIISCFAPRIRWAPMIRRREWSGEEGGGNTVRVNRRGTKRDLRGDDARKEADLMRDKSDNHL